MYNVYIYIPSGNQTNMAGKSTNDDVCVRTSICPPL